MLLLDTNVLSEVTKPSPNEDVLTWLHELDEDRTFISIVSIAEICGSIALMEKGRKQEALDKWLTDDLPQSFENRIIPVEDLSPGPGAISWRSPSEAVGGSPRWTE